MIHSFGHMLLNRQRKIPLTVGRLHPFMRSLRAALHLGRRDFNVCFVDDRQIRRLNKAFLGKNRPTDVLSFPWMAEGGPTLPSGGGRPSSKRIRPATGSEFTNFLGDVAISVETARRNACRAGHSTLHELRQLIVHGALHLMGYDHETDRGEMAALELSLRERLGIAAPHAARHRSRRQAGQKVRVCQ